MAKSVADKEKQDQIDAEKALADARAKNEEADKIK